MKTIAQNIYTIKELPKDVQKKVIEKNRHINVEHEWYDFIFDNFIIEAKKYGFIVTSKDIHFSGFYSQGDGACFDGEIKTRFKNVRFDIRKNHFAGNYCHSTTRFIDFENLYPDKPLSKIDKKLKELQENYKMLCDKLYKTLSDNYEHLTSDESILESLEANEYYFYNNGEFYKVCTGYF